MMPRLIDNLVLATPPKVLCAIFKRLPPSFFDWHKASSFGRVVRYAYRYSAFYKRKFDELKIDVRRVRRPEDLGGFYTMPEDVAEHAEEFLCRRPEIVFESSGTTGKNKRVYFSQEELDYLGQINAMGLFLGGMDIKDRVVNAFDFNIWIPGMVTQKGIEKAKIFGMVAGKIDPVEIYNRIPVYNFNTIFGEPTWLIKLTEIAERKGSYPLKFIVASAETMPEAAKPWMEKVWQGAQVRMVYASVETGGAIAFELSPECGAYHINENDFIVEIVDPDKDGYGEIAFTTLSRATMPLIRYRNRDIARLVPGRCPCGLPLGRVSRIHGRADEKVIAAAGNLNPAMFDSILKDVEGISTDWQIVFKLRGMKEVMEFNLEWKGSRDKAAIREDIGAKIKARFPDIWKNFVLGIFEMDFVYHAPGTLREKRKLVRLMDERYAI